MSALAASRTAHAAADAPSPRARSVRVIAIESAERPEQWAEVARLFEAFRQDAEQRYADQPWIGRTHFVPLAWRAELAQLPGEYAAPRGRLLLARVDGEAVGCVALRPRPDAADTAEIRRLYVEPSDRGCGLARALMARALTEARALGYAHAVLESARRQPEAHALYRQLGFVALTTHYRPLPPGLAAELIGFARALSPAS